jgi:uncharacterized protein
MPRSLPLTLALLLAAQAGLAQDRAPPPSLPPLPEEGPMRIMMQRTGNLPTILTLTAGAEVARAPDQVRLTAGVLTSGTSAAEAMAANAARMTAVLAALKAAGVADRDVQTTGLSLNPQYRYQPEQPPALTGYQARNSISLRTAKLADAGGLIDAAIKAGANEVQGPAFTLSNPDVALDEARAAAVAKARARAELYAKAAGLKVKRIASISEGAAVADPGPRPMLRAEMADVAGAPPVQPGELALRADVTVSFELEPLP